MRDRSCRSPRPSASQMRRIGVLSSRIQDELELLVAQGGADIAAGVHQVERHDLAAQAVGELLLEAHQRDADRLHPLRPSAATTAWPSRMATACRSGPSMASLTLGSSTMKPADLAVDLGEQDQARVEHVLQRLAQLARSRPRWWARSPSCSDQASLRIAVRADLLVVAFHVQLSQDHALGQAALDPAHHHGRQGGAGIADIGVDVLGLGVALRRSMRAARSGGRGPSSPSAWCRSRRPAGRPPR